MSIRSPPTASSIKAVIEDLERRHPGMGAERLLDEKGDIRRFVNIYLALATTSRFLDAINSKVKDGDDISIVPAIAGGR